MRRLLLGLFIFVCAGEAQTSRDGPPLWRTSQDTASFIKKLGAGAYTIGDVVGDSLTAGKFITWTKVPLSNESFGSTGYITKLIIEADTLNATNATFRLFLFADTASMALPVDNAVYVFNYLHRNLFLGYVDFTLQMPVATSTASYDVVNTLLPYRTKTNVSRIYGVLVATAAYVPKSYGKFWIAITFERN